MNLVAIQNGELGLRSAQFRDDMTAAQWTDVGQKLSGCHDSLKFWLGDWYVYGREHFPSHVQQALELIDVDDGTIRAYATVSRIPHSRRSKKLSFGHHKAIADMAPEPMQIELIKMAEDRQWSVPELRRHIAAAVSNEEAEDRGPITEFAPGRWSMEVVRISRKWNWTAWSAERKEALRRELQPAKEVLDQLWSS